MLYVSDCCFCFDLRSGALLLAWITTFTSLFGFNCSYLAFEKAMALPVISADTSDDKLWNVLLTLLACASFFVIFTSNVLMIMGIHMHKAHLVKAWLVVTLLQIFGGVVLALHFIAKFWWLTDNFLRAFVATAIMIGECKVTNGRHLLYKTPQINRILSAMYIDRVIMR